jgi:FMN phosphatase YigB (HAD superfamily)
MKTIIFDFYNTLYNPKNGQLFRGSLMLLKKLKRNSKLILISTETSDRQNELTRLGLIPFFNQIILCKQKNLPLFQRLFSPGTLIIGDRLEEEISIGKKLKLKTLLVDPKMENPIISIRKYLRI